MKQQKIAISFGLVLSVAHFFLFCKVMADFPAELRNSVHKQTRKRKAKVSWSRQEAEAYELSSHTDSTKRAHVRQELTSGSRPSSQNSAHGVNTERSFWVSKHLRPPQTNARRGIALKPIRSPTAPEVACCHSPWAFTLPKTPADLNLSSKAFTPLSIHELFQYHGSGFLTNLLWPGISLDWMIANEFKSFRQTKHTGLQKHFSPMLSYMSVQVSHRMGLWLGHYWHQIGSTFSKYDVSNKVDTEEEQMLFLPFIYQLLSKKPTLKQWFTVENIFIVFLVYWKIQFLYYNRELAVINEFEKSEILEKKAKALMWISEVLSHMFVPEFFKLVVAEKMKLTGENGGITPSKPSGFRLQSALGKLFDYLAGITAQTVSKSQCKATSDDVQRKRHIFSELLKLWQADCHDGFPLRAKRKNPGGINVPLRAGQKRLKDINRPFWENWCSASIDISLQSENFAKELKKPFPEFENLNKIRVGRSLVGAELNMEARRRLIDFENAALTQPDEECARTMDYILNLIPDLPINPPGEINSPEVFDFFLQYDKFHREMPLYIPDQFKAFFNLKETLGSKFKFWSSFERHRKTRKNLARKHRDRCAKKSNIEQHSPKTH